MFLLRAARENDLESLFELSKLVTFINLPADKAIIDKKIKLSIRSFAKPSSELYQNYYIFVCEDLKSKSLVGVSMIHAQHGTQDSPHFYLDVFKEQKYSETINTGFIHGILKLGYDTDGPTEIGGLVIHPKYRKNKEKLGKQLSFVRFLYMAEHQNCFKKDVLAELMPPLDKDGNSPLWEAIGRKFMNMDYVDADILSRNNKEFILSLFPSEVIYEPLLPIKARNSIGKVGENTEPVKQMLSNIGFKYNNQVDPFDGGPHYWCKFENIEPIKKYKRLKVTTSDIIDQTNTYLISNYINDNFNAYMISGTILNDNKLAINDEQMKKLNLNDGQEVGCCPF